MKPALTLDDASKFMAVAEEEAKRNKWEMVIAIRNDGGTHRRRAPDGSRKARQRSDRDRQATTSAMTCRPSVVWERWIDGRHKAYTTFPFIAAHGGMPIIIDGDPIGAVACRKSGRSPTPRPSDRGTLS